MKSTICTFDDWVSSVSAGERDAIEAMSASERKDAFYRDLAFGTGGLRGKLGLGSNRLNSYTMGKATQGLADWLNANLEGPTVALCRDTRHGSEEFVRRAASVLAANGIKTYMYERVEPTPALSFAVRELVCSAGVNITASHNPAAYNGYKVYGADGCQITVATAEAIQAAIDAVDPFEDVRAMPYDEAVASGLALTIDEAVFEMFVDLAAAQATGVDCSGLCVVYTPLHGVGLECVSGALSKIGVTDIRVVEEQAVQDGAFPTCPYPIPEVREALELGLELCEETKADLLFATDPDCDRICAGVRQGDTVTLISGNDMGVLLLDYICAGRIEKGTMPKNPVAVKSIVSTPLADAVAKHYGVEMRNVLTGFKWIGDQIANLEAAGEVDRFIFGFEESYGYLAGPYVRDKDAVIGSMLICEMAAYYRSIGSSIKQRLEEIYAQYGRYLNKVDSFEFPGLTGMEKMASIMQKLRDQPPVELAGHKVVKVTDYKKPEETGLPAANVLIYTLENGATVVVRPSGTEPKIKTYFTTLGKDLAEAQAQKDALAAAIEPILK